MSLNLQKGASEDQKMNNELNMGLFKATVRFGILCTSCKDCVFELDRC